jgi:hypothetical protein
VGQNGRSALSSIGAAIDNLLSGGGDGDEVAIELGPFASQVGGDDMGNVELLAP